MTNAMDSLLLQLLVQTAWGNNVEFHFQEIEDDHLFPLLDSPQFMPQMLQSPFIGVQTQHSFQDLFYVTSSQVWKRKYGDYLEDGLCADTYPGASILTCLTNQDVR